jgi:hypothetical protein
VPANLLTVAQRDDALTVLDARLLGTGVEAHVDALLAQDTEDQLADGRVLAVDQPVAALHERDRDAEARIELSELDADRSAAEDDDALGQLLERGRLAVGPVAGFLKPVDRRDDGVAAGRDDDAVGLQRAAVDLDAARSRDAGTSIAPPPFVRAAQEGRACPMHTR